MSEPEENRPMTPRRWGVTCAYLSAVFGDQDEFMRSLMPRAVAAGLPDIAVAPEVGRLLTILARLVGARLAVEVGTLAGYSGIWIARGLADGGRLITVEPEPAHADFASQAFKDAGVADRVTIRRQKGIEALTDLGRDPGPGCADLVFLDAIKTEYPEYLKLAKPLIRPGGLLVADNILGSGSWWIDESPGLNPSRDAADRLNRLVAADPDFEAVGIPLRQGLLIARRRA